MTSSGDPIDPLLPSLENIVEAMAEAALVLDRTGTVVTVNGSMMRLLGVSDRNSLLCPIAEYDDLISDWRVGNDPFVPSDLRRSLEGASIRFQRATITTNAGVERVVEFSTTPIRDSENVVRFAMLVAQDHTESERTQKYWQAVGTAAQGLTSNLDVDSVLRSVIDMITAAFGDRVVLGVWRLDASRGHLHLQIYRGISDATAELLRTLPADGDSFICDAVRTREPQYLEDAQETPPPGEIDRRLVEDEGLTSWVASPLLTGTNLIGAMGYGLRAPQRIYRQDLEAVRTIGRLFAVAIEHAELYEESERQRETLEDERSERSLFVSALAHDLRSPLTVLRGTAQVLKRSPDLLPAERRDEYLTMVEEQVARLVRLVNDLSDVYVTTEPRYQLDRQTVDLVSLVQHVVAAVEPTASGHQFRIDAPTEIRGQWDPARLEQVLDNLLSNAVKFSPAGSDIVVSLTTQPGEMLLAVTDQGVGLEASDLPKVFMPFMRVGTPDGTEGHGLGLYIASNIVRLHGGRIWAESAGPGTGVTVSLVLPYEEPASAIEYPPTRFDASS